MKKISPDRAVGTHIAEAVGIIKDWRDSMKKDACKHCGACDCCDRCNHCGHCRKCGKYVAPPPTYYPIWVWPTYPFTNPYYPTWVTPTITYGDTRTGTITGNTTTITTTGTFSGSTQ